MKQNKINEKITYEEFQKIHIKKKFILAINA